MQKISCPLIVSLPRKTKAWKRCSINLNQYRNWHYQISNQVKRQFKEKIQTYIDELPTYERLYIHYIVYPRTKLLHDTGNIQSITSKFLLDSLVEDGKITDDNYTIVLFESAETRQVDKHNPRCDVYLSSEPIYTTDKYFF